MLKHDCFTLTVYQGKNSKNALLLSTMHSAVKIGDNKKLLSKTVAFCNATKWEVDMVDQMANNHNVNAVARRWPVKYFYNISDLAAIYTYILYKKVTDARIERQRFLLQLAEELRC